MIIRNRSKEVRDGVLVYSETGQPVFNAPSWHPPITDEEGAEAPGFDSPQSEWTGFDSQECDDCE